MPIAPRVTPGAPPSWAASEPSWAPPEPSWSCPQYPTFNLQPVQLPPLGMPNLQPWAPLLGPQLSGNAGKASDLAPSAAGLASDVSSASGRPNLLAPKGLAPPKGIDWSVALWLWPVAALGISAKQDQEILHTLQSSGLAGAPGLFRWALPRFHRPEADINQMLSIATQAKLGDVGFFEGLGIDGQNAKVRLKSGSMVEAEAAHGTAKCSGTECLQPADLSSTRGSPVMRVVAIANSQSLLRIQQAIDSGMHVGGVTGMAARPPKPRGRAGKAVKTDGGFLTWSNGQIRDFVRAQGYVMTVFIQLGLAIFLVDGQEQASRRPVSSFSSSLSSPVAEAESHGLEPPETTGEELKAAEAAAAEDEHLGRPRCYAIRVCHGHERSDYRHVFHLLATRHALAPDFAALCYVNMALPMKKSVMKSSAMKSMKKTAMKVMKKKAVSKIARGKRAKASVFKGNKEKTASGHAKTDLMKNKRGKVVSKLQNAAGKKAYKNISAWNTALMQARKELGIKGFCAVNGKTAQGKALYAKAKAIFAA
ncbi:Dinoflagellate viral nucleoprotein 5 (DNVP5) [Durusdinium trenchii]|uniref:Dinoflagellate viral nucleoprotein 5 (DNVP5) n=1 Tax=Durusdinium trenchii TaxID=1381693 RepID=A0ABP0SAP7_9DINO